jgi:hypothetical protein
MSGSPVGDTDPFDLLGVAEDASDKAIRAAWKGLIRDCHPDNATDDADRWARQARSAALNGARDVLLDPGLRAAVSFRRRWGLSTPAEPIYAPPGSAVAQPQAGAASRPWDEAPAGSGDGAQRAPVLIARDRGLGFAGALRMLAHAAYALLRSPVVWILCLVAVLVTTLTRLPPLMTGLVLLLAILAYALMNEPSDTSHE